MNIQLSATASSTCLAMNNKTTSAPYHADNSWNDWVNCFIVKYVAMESSLKKNKHEVSFVFPLICFRSTTTENTIQNKRIFK